jgi:hypothetical protein
VNRSLSADFIRRRRFGEVFCRSLLLRQGRIKNILHFIEALIYLSSNPQTDRSRFADKACHMRAITQVTAIQLQWHSFCTTPGSNCTQRL